MSEEVGPLLMRFRLISRTLMKLGNAHGQSKRAQPWELEEGFVWGL